MKLLNRTLIWLSGALLLALTIWAVIFYVSMLDEVHDSIDDGLDNSRLLIIHESKQDPLVLKQRHFDEGNYAIRPLEKKQALQPKDRYEDTLMFMENEQELEPVRVLTTAFRASDGRHYELKVISSMVEEDDLIEGLFYSLLWLYVILVFSIVVINNLLLRSIWKPFYRILDKLKQFRLGKQEQIEPETTSITEFQLLNDTIREVLQSNIRIFNNQKQLIENASHELQTPLAIALNKLQLFAGKNELTENQVEEVFQVINTLERLTRLNKSLLLLSKIENRQFTDIKPVEMNALCRELLDDFSDVAQHKETDISVEEEALFVPVMHKDLAMILLTNLIKNALVHTMKGGKVRIRILASSFTIENSGAHELDAAAVFKRFYKATDENRSSGLGLAIVKSICNVSGLEISYSFSNGMHAFQVKRGE